MDFLESHSVLIGVILFLVSNASIYVKFSNDLSYIKGRLAEVLKGHDDITALVAKHAKLEADFSITVTRIALIEKQFLNGGFHAGRS